MYFPSFTPVILRCFTPAMTPVYLLVRIDSTTSARPEVKTDYRLTLSPQATIPFDRKYRWDYAVDNKHAHPLGAGVLETSNATLKVLQDGDDFNNLLGEMTRRVQAEVAAFIGGESGTVEMVWGQGETEHGRRASVPKKDGTWEYLWWEVVMVDVV
jgi:hypothetical protein